MLISSVHNSKIKDIIRLEKASERKKTGLFVAEGIREVIMALESSFVIDQVFICESLFNPTDEQNKKIKQLKENTSLIYITKEVYQKIAYRESTEGIIIIAKQKINQLKDLILNKDFLGVVLENPEKPGNVGAILRTLDACGADVLIISGNEALDIYNPNTIRSSLGAFFTVPIIKTTNEEVLLWLQKNNIAAYTTSNKGSKNLYETKLNGKNAFIMGSEAKGMSDFWQKNVNNRLFIPMFGKGSSLNLSVATSIMVYEYVRQIKLANTSV